MSMNEQEEQWLTGFTEGDGNVGVYKVGLYYAKVTWGQKEREVLDYIAHLLSTGNVRIKRGTGYQLAYAGKTCVPLLEVFAKHVVSKNFLRRLSDVLEFLELPPTTTHEPSIDWLSGFWDAEGSSSNRPILFIAQKDREILDIITDKFGGRVQPLQNYNMHQWYLCGSEARKLAHEIMLRSHKPAKAKRLRNNFEGPTYYELHKEDVLARQHTYYESHKEERLACAHKYNKKKWQERKLVREYIKKHPEVLTK